jgi:glycosyltransferase involved in cell wall biosynthesis
MRVLFAQRRLPHYRVGLIDLTRELLVKQGVQFDFIYGQPNAAERSKADEGQLPWAQHMKRTRYAFNGKLVWQPFDISGYDLVIVGQENRLLFNHWLCRSSRTFKLGFFGHGANLAASNSSSWAERFKRWSTRRADWFFAYTNLSHKLVVRGAGFPTERVTVMNNASDTTLLRTQLAAVSPADLARCRTQFQLTAGKTGIFVGSIYPGKALPLLLEAARLVHQADPQFRLLVVGDGPSRATVQAKAADQPYVHWLGAQHGAEKAKLMAAADFLLMPCYVGLSIVDGFAAGLPLLSTDAPGHGPEIAYLNPGRNGECSAANALAYASAISAVLSAPATLAQLRAQARADGQLYSVQTMAERFSQGIVAALATPRRAETR